MDKDDFPLVENTVMIVKDFHPLFGPHPRSIEKRCGFKQICMENVLDNVVDR
jgi:hypothetical protein